MKRKFALLPLVFTALTFCMTSCSPAEAEADDAERKGKRTLIRLAYEDKTNPPRFLGSGLTVPARTPGMTLELINLAAERLGLEIHYRRMPWKRCLMLADSGEVDGIFHASYKESRSIWGAYPMKNDRPDPSRSLFEQVYALYVRKDSHVQWNGVTLSGLDGPVGITLGYSIQSDLEKLGVHTAPLTSQMKNLQRLAQGRIGAYADLETMTDPLIRANPEEFGNIVKLPIPLETKPYYLLFSRRFTERHPGLAERIWDTCTALMHSEEFRGICLRYGVPDLCGGNRTDRPGRTLRHLPCPSH
ncbi:substrate-binding periplasmic protein [Pseudodesulfovibrio tunisiensis]|uniref:substrate-binding periplasmic protein n=1 Tax=Pseudodesulfovibrio tunisiensis TaxID=463192 RepID=UPI001FB205A3|nr:transporter substrate-binding domain-containing protein [Pseudodesulfovibrio tunisiensis]